ncbi:DUF6731 family protein [Gracilibacillus phocaeensis]|uniref:DUF6731 family protein n=1 Tax=Gracilibacillus phocaeensis TaxID=2042304 RepID=UPI0010324CAA|nr:DUF6731 family protein [Gracilibacillus phocaeensis]
MARKYIRFNYFEVNLVPAEDAIRRDLNEDEDIPFQANVWDMSDFLDYLMVNRREISTTVDIGTEYSEVEKDSYHYDERRDLYSFQLSKLRETNIPSKKKFGEIKEDILLDQDEYIGEFNSIVFDNTYKALIMQSNLYGLSVAQTEHVLTQLRFKYLDRMGRTEEVPLVVKLNPIIDNSKVQKVIESDYFKKIRLKGSDFMMDAALDDDSLLTDARRLLHQSSGLNIDITISLGRTERTSSLNQEYVQSAIRRFEAIGESKPKMEVTALYDEEADVETINLIEPRMTVRVSVDVAPRQTVGHEYLYQTFLEIFDTQRYELRRVLVR